MITQRFRLWLRRVFAWWPWRQIPPVDYRHDIGALSVVAPSEGVSHSTQGTTTQANTSYFSTLDDRPTYTNRTPSPANDDPAVPPNSPADISRVAGEAVSSQNPPAPTPQQRLEFLRYLVRQGIVNEGREEK